MSKSELYLIGVFILAMALLFNFLETWYFGWNKTAFYSAEIICDYISKLGLFAGLSIMIYAAFIRFWEV